jgi:rhodanese-related sulfurtransferase
VTDGRISAGSRYAGDVSPREAYEALLREPKAQLIDVRTDAEWNFVGLPDLAEANRRPLLCQWQLFPAGGNAAFVEEAEAALSATGYRKGMPLYLLCRSGARSRAAAIAMTAAGHGPCFNIAEGFEGALDTERHRGKTGGWKAEGLPWVQS